MIETTKIVYCFGPDCEGCHEEGSETCGKAWKNKNVFDFENRDKRPHVCPFCGESDFDLVGLKGHLVHDCEVFAQTETIERRF